MYSSEIQAARYLLKRGEYSQHHLISVMPHNQLLLRSVSCLRFEVIFLVIPLIFKFQAKIQGSYLGS